MTADSAVFVDTNVLLTATTEGRPLREQALRVLTEWPERGVRLHASAQVIREYLVVATRPAEANGMGLSAAQALENVDAFEARMTVLPESRAASALFKRLMRDSALKGKRLHDVYLAASAITSGCDVLVTANPGDFELSGLEIEIQALSAA